MTMILLCLMVVLRWDGASSTLSGVDLMVSGNLTRSPTISVGRLVGESTTDTTDEDWCGRLRIGVEGLWLLITFFTVCSFAGFDSKSG